MSLLINKRLHPASAKVHVITIWLTWTAQVGNNTTTPGIDIFLQFPITFSVQVPDQLDAVLTPLLHWSQLLAPKFVPSH